MELPFVHAATNQVTGGVYRVSGTASDGRATLPWSVVLKVARNGAEMFRSDDQDLLSDEGGSEAVTVRLDGELRSQRASIDEVTHLGGYQTTMAGSFRDVTRHFRTNQEPIEVVWLFRTDAAGLIDSIN